MKLSLSCTVSLVLLSNFKYSKADGHFFRHDYEYVDKTNAFYKVHCVPRPWLQAVQVCALEGATILTPHDSKELTTVLPLIGAGGKKLWLGYHTIQKKTDQTFYAINDEKNFVLQWGPGQPAKGFKYCVHIYDTQYYGTENCGTKMQFICKWYPGLNRLDDSRYGIEQGYKKGYTYSPKSNAYFKVHQTPMTWISAVVKCAEEGAMLASPLDYNEMNEVLQYITKDTDTIWIGVHGLHTERLFQHLNYEDNTSPYIKWDATEPNNMQGREDCLELYSSGNYNDITCDLRRRFVCRNDEFSSSLLRRLRCCEKPGVRNDFDYCRVQKRFLNINNVSSSNITMSNSGASSQVVVIQPSSQPSRGNHSSSVPPLPEHSPPPSPSKGNNSSSSLLVPVPPSQPPQGGNNHGESGNNKHKGHKHPKN